MSGKNRTERAARRRAGLAVERLEARGLLSVVPIFMARGHLAAHDPPALLTSISASDPGTLAAAAGQPTPHELARQHFVSKASGSFVTGPGRYSNQALQAYINASGGSTHSLHVDVQVRYFVPTDPTQPITGVATLIPRNVSTTGSTLILDLQAPPAAGSTALPGHFTWTVDPTSGGLYTNAGGFGMGQGTLDVHYVAGGKRPGRVFSAGRAFLVLHGLINADGIFSDVGGSGNSSGGP